MAQGEARRPFLDDLRADRPRDLPDAARLGGETARLRTPCAALLGWAGRPWPDHPADHRVRRAPGEGAGCHRRHPGALRRLRAPLRHADVDPGLSRTILVSHATRGEGATAAPSRVFVHRSLVIASM